MHDDFGIGEEVPVGGVIEVQMTQYHQIHIFGCDTELRQRVDDGSTLVVTGSVEKQPPPTCGGYKVTTAPAKEATTAFPGKATKQHFDVGHENLFPICCCGSSASYGGRAAVGRAVFGRGESV